MLMAGSDAVLGAVVVVHRSGDVMHQVAGDLDEAAAFVEIDAPRGAPVVVDVVVRDDRAGLIAKHVDAAAVVHFAHYVVDVVVRDSVFAADRGLLVERTLHRVGPAAGVLFSPAPAGADAAVWQVADFIVS